MKRNVVSASGAPVGVGVAVGSGLWVGGGEGFGVAMSLKTAGDTVGVGVRTGDAPGCAKDGIAMPRSPTRMTLPIPKSTTAVTALASPTAPIRSSACLTAISNAIPWASQRVGAAYPALHR